jgi:hypothetical protein
LLFVALLSLFIGSVRPVMGGTFSTYAAWSDVAAKNRGHMYIYTGNYPSTDVTLTYALAPNVSMATMQCGFPVVGVGPYQPVAEVGSCPLPATGGFGNRYFKCASTNPIIWEVEENIASTEEDSHDFKAGKAAALGAIVGAVMKASKGKANPQQVNDLLRDRLR